MESIGTAKVPFETEEHKILPEVRLQELRAIYEKSSFPVPEEHWEGKNYKELLEQGKRLDYMALSL